MIEIPMIVYLVLLASFSCVVTYLFVKLLGKLRLYLDHKRLIKLQTARKLVDLQDDVYRLDERYRELTTKVDTLLEQL